MKIGKQNQNNGNVTDIKITALFTSYKTIQRNCYFILIYQSITFLSVLYKQIWWACLDINK